MSETMVFDCDDSILLVPPKRASPDPAHERTPSLTSSLTSADSSDHHPTPPDTARSSRARSALSSPLKLSHHDGGELFLSPTSIALSPVDSTVSPLPRPPRAPRPNLNSRNSGHISTYDRKSQVRSASSTLLLRGSQSSIVLITEHPNVLASLLTYISFPEFHALCCTSKAMRRLLDELPLRDVVLNRFVPGYNLGSEQFRESSHEEIYVELKDLETLMLSQAIPLHIYSNSAAQTLSGVPISESCTRLQHFTDVHSRFVLLMRSRAPPLNLHSDSDDASFSRHGSDGLPQLTLPAPLAFEEEAEAPTAKTIEAKNHLQMVHEICPIATSATSGSASIHLYHKHDDATNAHVPRPLAKSLQKRIFALNAITGPVTGTDAVTYWEASLPAKSRDSICDEASQDPVEDPNRNEYLDQCVERFQEEIGAAYVARVHTLGRTRGYTVLATIKTVAPPDILLTNFVGLGVGTFAQAWIIVHGWESDIRHRWTARADTCQLQGTCATWNESALHVCEEQLVAANLWDWLNVGDVVCNLGFVPTPRRESLTDVHDMCDNVDESGKNVPSMGWMVFTGRNLLPLSIPALPGHIDGLQLPTPLYYVHLLPLPTLTTPASQTNPRFIFSIPPVAPGVELRLKAADLTLTCVTSCVGSPGTKGLAIAKVVRWCWVAKVDGSRLLGSLAPVGEGWCVDWVIEVEGTREGRDALVDAINGTAQNFNPNTDNMDVTREWEVVREKSIFGSRLWMRLVIAPLSSTDPTDELGRLEV
ncbi:hypothetical protein FRB96_002979 [Tulasnella sp. 330]|nr:hypothetical protein FRB96_002979 [Tulasnella sp. 330]